MCRSVIRATSLSDLDLCYYLSSQTTRKVVPEDLLQFVQNISFVITRVAVDYLVTIFNTGLLNPVVLHNFENIAIFTIATTSMSNRIRGIIEKSVTFLSSCNL
jgi:hypothetical protein